nr:Endonuclease exonuclease phosphatase domain containing protein [Haemonchus contortus]
MRGLPRSERPRPKKIVRIETLNVGSLTEKSREVADLMKRRNIQVLCLQETRWKGAKAKEIGEGVKLYYNGDDIKPNGVAIAVAESLKHSASAVSRISSRIMAVRIDTKEGNWTIILVYAPQAGCPIYEKDEFYLGLDETIRSLPEGDYLTIAGDLNGHIGSERRGLERVHGGKGVGVRNDEGERVLALAIAHDLAVCSTFFAKRKSQKVTHSSGGKEMEIDHVLVRRLSLKTVKDVKVLPGEDLAPQRRPTSRHSHRSSQEIEDKNGTEDPVVEVAPFRKKTPQRDDTGSWTPKSRRADLADLEQRCGGHPAMCKGNAGGNSRWFPRGQGSMVLE